MIKTLPKNAGFTIFADNYFTSIPLVEKLQKDGFFMLEELEFHTGEVGNVKMKKTMKKKTMKKKRWGSTDFKVLSDENIIILRWFDNKPVNFISYVAVDQIDSVRCYDQR